MQWSLEWRPPVTDSRRRGGSSQEEAGAFFPQRRVNKREKRVCKAFYWNASSGAKVKRHYPARIKRKTSRLKAVNILKVTLLIKRAGKEKECWLICCWLQVRVKLCSNSPIWWPGRAMEVRWPSSFQCRNTHIGFWQATNEILSGRLRMFSSVSAHLRSRTCRSPPYSVSL